MSDQGTFVRLLDPSTGQIEQVAPQDALAAWQSGKRQLVAGDQIPLVHPDGTTALVPAEGVEAKVRDGWGFATRHDILAEQAKDQPVRSAAEALASQLTFGVSDFAMGQAGVEGLAERRDTPVGQVSSAVGLGLSLLGPGLVADGAKALSGQVLEAALAPTLAADAVGQGIERAASSALDGVIANRAVQHAVASGLGQAATGAAYGFGGALSEESLGDADVNAEHLLAGAGMGALLGAAGGGLTGGLRGMLEARAAKKAVTALTPDEGASVIQAAGYDVSPDAAKRFWPKVQRMLAGASEAVGYDGEKIALVNTPYARSVMHDLEGEVETRGRALKDAADAVEANRASNIDAVYERRQGKLAELLPAGAAPSVVQRAGDLLGDLRGKLDGLRSELLAQGLSEAQADAYVARHERLLNGVEDEAFAAAGVPREVTVRREVRTPVDNSAEIAHRNQAADEEYRRAVDAYALGRAKGGVILPSEPNETAATIPPRPARVAPDLSDLQAYETRIETTKQQLSLSDLADRSAGLPDTVSFRVFNRLNKVKQLLAEDARFAESVEEAGARERASYFKDMYGAVKDHLSDSSVYGKAGDFQRETSDAYAALTAAQQKLRRAFKLSPDAEFTSQSVANHLNSLSKFRGDDAVEAFDQWRNAQGAYAQSVDRYFPEAGILNRTEDALAKFDDARAKASDAVGVKTALKDLITERGRRFGFQGNGALGPALGAAAGALGAAALGPVGVGAVAVGGVLAHAVMDPGRFAQAVAAAQLTGQRVGRWLDNRAARLAGVAVSKVAEALPRTISRSTRAILDATSADARRQAYDARLAELNDLVRRFPDHAAQQLIGVSDKLPRHAMAMTQSGQAALQILLQNLPRPRAGSYQDVYAKPTPLDSDIRKFAQIDAAIQDPLSVLDRAADGKLVQRHEMDAVAAAFPRLLAGFRQSVATHVGAARSRPSAGLQRAQKVVFGMPEGDPGHLARWQALYASPAAATQPGPAPGGKPLRSTPQRASLSTKLMSFPFSP